MDRLLFDESAPEPPELRLQIVLVVKELTAEHLLPAVLIDLSATSLAQHNSQVA